MSYVHRTMIVKAGDVVLARNLAAGLSGPAGEGMWGTGLSTTGTGTATHYVSAGMIGEEFVNVISDADVLFGMCDAAGLPVTLEQCESLVANSDISEEEPFAAFERLGLKLVQEETN